MVCVVCVCVVCGVCVCVWCVCRAYSSVQDCSVSVYIHGSEEICVRVIDDKLGVLICCDLCESVHLMSIYMLCECSL